MIDHIDRFLEQGQGFTFASTWLQCPPPDGPIILPAEWEHPMTRESCGGWNTQDLWLVLNSMLALNDAEQFFATFDAFSSSF